jgi:Ca2+-binding EF-hand superfamily protein
MGTVFDSFDEDKDGHITLREVKSMFTELKLRTSIGTGSIQTDTEDGKFIETSDTIYATICA